MMPMKALAKLKDDAVAIWWGFVSVVVLAACWLPFLLLPALLLVALLSQN